MDARRHSVDFPISRTLVALRRVRSLRDPSTNSMSKLCALVDNLNWETKSSNAIYLGLGNGCSGGANDDNALELRSSNLFMMNKQHVSNLELFHSSRHCDSGKILCKTVENSIGKTGSMPTRSSNVEYSDGHSLKQEMVCEGKNWNKIYHEDDGEVEAVSNSMAASCDAMDSGSCFSEPEKRSKQPEKRTCVRLKRKGWSRNGKSSFRVIAGDALCHVVSPYMTASDATGPCSGLPLCRSDDIGMMEPGHQGCGISSCWSRTPKVRESNLQGRLGRHSMEEWPLLLENAGQALFTEGSAELQHIDDGRGLGMDSPRSPCQKFIPKSFKELVGQDVVARSLTSAISSGRIASLYLFHGPRGTGKTSAARIFAAALNCISPEIDKPCGVCQDCVSFFCGRSRDIKEVHSVTINSIKKFRSLIKNADAHPVYSRYKVYIIEECHLLRGETWASILNKTEELPQHVFVMVTPDLDKLPFSAVSKSQRYHFQLVKEVDIAHRLGKVGVDEGFEFEEDALNLIATRSNGSLRDAAMMLDHLSLLGKKITVPLVYEVNGAVSDDELLVLLQLAMSSEASNTVKKARELMRSRIDPLQLISQLANLIMDILASKREEGYSEIRRNFCDEVNRQQLSCVLKILSETEKQLRMSKNQKTWLTVALLQLGSAGASPDENDSAVSLRTVHPQDDEFLGASTNGECLKHPVVSSCENVESGKLGIQNDAETLELIWKRATGTCDSGSLKNFLQKRGKLASVLLSSGTVVAELEFDHPDFVSRAEKSWKVIARALQHMLGYNVELRINLASNVSCNDHRKLKKSSFRLFSCSRRVHLRPQYCTECGSNASESSSYTVTAGDRCLETCTIDSGSQVSHHCCFSKDMVTTIRNSDGNALSIGTTTPHRSLPDRTNQPGSDSWNTNQSRRRQCWRCSCWRTATFPFRRAQMLIQKKLC